MRVIPISRAAAAASPCGDESGEVPKLKLPLVRREFLKGSGILVGTIATSSVLAMLAPSSRKLAIVKAMEGQPFFNAVRGQCVTSLYDNDMAFAVFGYPGSSWEKGGYITRGFQDLRWLPNPTAEQSPPPYLG